MSANTQECVGFPLTWRMRDSGDDYSRAFADLDVPYRRGEIMRVRGGDNRFLPIPVRSEYYRTCPFSPHSCSRFSRP
jgi:hypothetical protein